MHKHGKHAYITSAIKPTGRLALELAYFYLIPFWNHLMTSEIQKDLSKMNKIPLSRVDGLSVAPLWSAYPDIRAMEKN